MTRLLTILVPVLLLAACAAPARAPLAGAAAPAPGAPERAPRARAPATGAEPRAAAELSAAARALSAGDPAACLTALDRARALGEQGATWWLLHAMARLDQGDAAGAAADLEQVVTLEPDDGGSWALLGRARFELGELEAAREALRAAVARDPEVAQHRGSLGLVCLELGAWEEAHGAFAAGLDLDEDLLVAHQGMARLYTLADMPDAAVLALERSVELAPGDPVLRVELGHALRDVGLRAEALSAYRAADQLDPGNPWIAANLGAVLLELEAWAEARDRLWDARRGLAERGRVEPGVERSLGEALLALGRPRAARDALQSAFELDPALPGLAEQLGLLLRDMGEDAAAAEVLDTADALGALGPAGTYAACLLAEQRGELNRAHGLATRLLAAAGQDPERGLLAARLRLRSQLPLVRDAAAAAALLEELTAGALRGHPSSWLLLAEARVATGALDRAVVAVDRALALLTAGDPAAREARATRAALVARLSGAGDGER